MTRSAAVARQSGAQTEPTDCARAIVMRNVTEFTLRQTATVRASAITETGKDRYGTSDWGRAGTRQRRVQPRQPMLGSVDHFVAREAAATAIL